MANLNIAPIYGSIHSDSGGSLPGRESSNIINGNINTSWSSDDDTAWVVIDLGASFNITGFKAWRGTEPDTARSVRHYRIYLSDEADSGFTLVWFGEIDRPIWAGRELSDTSDTSVISPRTARYITYALSSNWGSPMGISSGELEIYSDSSVGEQGQVDIYSIAEIYAISGQADIQSNARIRSPYVAIESSGFTSDVIFIQGNNIRSNTWVTDTGSQIISNADILATENVNIVSNTFIYRSGSAAEMPIFAMGRATNHADWRSELDASGSRGLLVYTTDISTSDETVVADMITGSPMDMATIVPPLGYQNYDWKYDWVVRDYNSAQYKFEIRTGDKLSELRTAVFHRIQQDQIILRGQIPRYHQWRCHVWASGSGDFELHQFTIKGYVDYPANPLYCTLQNRPFTTVSPIKKNVQRLYEPLDPKLWGDTYIPGDCNADGIVDVYDLAYLGAYIFSGSSAPNPVQAGDINYDGIIDEEDFTYLTQYLYNDGPPPIWDIT